MKEAQSLYSLKNQTDIKVLICYILETVGRPVTKEVILQSVSQEGLSNYFDLNAALADLLEKGCLAVSGAGDEETYALTDIGRQSGQTLTNTLSLLVRSRAAKAALRAASRAVIAKENRAEIKKAGSGYEVNLQVMEGETAMLNLTLRCGDGYQAEQIKARFLEDPAALYQGTVGLLLEPSAEGE